MHRCWGVLPGEWMDGPCAATCTGMQTALGYFMHALCAMPSYVMHIMFIMHALCTGRVPWLCETPEAGEGRVQPLDGSHHQLYGIKRSLILSRWDQPLIVT